MEAKPDPWKTVSKEEFDAFVKGYPRPLEVDVTGICEPPMVSYNDFSDGKVWPESMVARTWDVRGYPNEKPRYSIRKGA